MSWMVSSFHSEMIQMTDKQRQVLEKLYNNCRAHGEDTDAFWEDTTKAFYDITNRVNEQTFTELAVDYYMQLQREFCEALKGA